MCFSSSAPNFEPFSRKFFLQEISVITKQQKNICVLFSNFRHGMRQKWTSSCAYGGAKCNLCGINCFRKKTTKSQKWPYYAKLHPRPSKNEQCIIFLFVHAAVLLFMHFCIHFQYYSYIYRSCI